MAGEQPSVIPSRVAEGDCRREASRPAVSAVSAVMEVLWTSDPLRAPSHITKPGLVPGFEFSGCPLSDFLRVSRRYPRQATQPSGNGIDQSTDATPRRSPRTDGKSVLSRFVRVNLPACLGDFVPQRPPFASFGAASLAQDLIRIHQYNRRAYASQLMRATACMAVARVGLAVGQGPRYGRSTCCRRAWPDRGGGVVPGSWGDPRQSRCGGAWTAPQMGFDGESRRPHRSLPAHDMHADRLPSDCPRG